MESMNQIHVVRQKRALVLLLPKTLLHPRDDGQFITVVTVAYSILGTPNQLTPHHKVPIHPIIWHEPSRPSANAL